MGFARLLLLVALIGFTLHWWKSRDPASSPEAALAAVEPSPSGFVPAAMPDGAPPDTVVILAPLNCSSEEAQRADSLAEELEGRRIPVLRSSRFNGSGDASDASRLASLQRAVAVMKGAVPAVFVNGMAKANPSAEEVIAEYERSQ